MKRSKSRRLANYGQQENYGNDRNRSQPRGRMGDFDDEDFDLEDDYNEYDDDNFEDDEDVKNQNEGGQWERPSMNRRGNRGRSQYGYQEENVYGRYGRRGNRSQHA